MFDFGFSELMIIAVVALIVVGPERLPKLARAAGHFIGRAQRYVNTIKADIQREVDLEELKKLQVQVEASARELETSVRGHAHEIREAADLLKEKIDPHAHTTPKTTEDLGSHTPTALAHSEADAPTAHTPAPLSDGAVGARLDLSKPAAPDTVATPLQEPTR